jgi:glycosyltransferase domain-containing protein
MFTGLNDLTIVIPTVSRPLFVLRQFEYWGETDAHVVILDGATSPIRIPETVQHPNVRYVHTGTRFNVRLATAGAHVHTKYCALLTDDEFFLPSGLLAAIDRLENDPSVIGCVGRSLYFFVDQGRFLLKDAYREWKPFSTEANSLRQRLDEDLPPNKTHKAQFAVMHTRAWIQMFEQSYSVFFSSGYTYERLLNLSRTILGRTEILEDLLWMRSMENPPISSANVPRTGKSAFLPWAQSKEFADEVKQFRGIALRMLTDAGLTLDEAKEYEKRFFEGGVEQTLKRKSKLRKRFRDWYRARLLRWSPKSLRLLAKRKLPAEILSFSGWEGYEFDKMTESLLQRETRFEVGELRKIQDLSLLTAQRVLRGQVVSDDR